MIKINHRGSFNKTEKFLKGVVTSDYMRVLERYAMEGVRALSSATPVDSGETANSWYYTINHYSDSGSYVITWSNRNVENGVPVAILIQYGHATRNGGYVQGRDYINPALQPLFDRMANDVWREVTKL